ncbi:hypothetical protein ACFFQW_27960 [Umezawaea endophytica]|uniref:Uncharacterized protein n=1 Tax=Umezawaea endophytica TaxID=1654476 RepID=A0A9X3AF13_9PSEU|nr:hypothetical protein [Umezawaea endophytica]MCS7476595.1 hypothetical protein [Umezawaea endophytica]
MTETPAPQNDAGDVDEAIEAPAPEAEPEPEFVPNRRDRRGSAKKASQNSKIPGQMHNNNVVGKRSFSNRRSGG